MTMFEIRADGINAAPTPRQVVWQEKMVYEHTLLEREFN